jgi:hypothetical protein
VKQQPLHLLTFLTMKVRNNYWQALDKRICIWIHIWIRHGFVAGDLCEDPVARGAEVLQDGDFLPGGEPLLCSPSLPPAWPGQVYNETVLDLLNHTPQLLSIREDGKDTSIPGLTLHKVMICVFAYLQMCICAFPARQPCGDPRAARHGRQ